MKHFKITLIALLCIGLALPDKVQAQRVTRNMVAYVGSGTVGAGGRDTTVNTDTTYLYLGASSGSTIGTGLANSDGSFQYGCDVSYEWSAAFSITGTTTATIYFQGSNTGTFAAWTSTTPNMATQDWVMLYNDVTQVGGSTANSFTISSTVKKGYFNLTNCQFKYVRAVIVTGGTQTSAYTAKATILSPPGGD